MAARRSGAELLPGGEHGAAGTQAFPIHALQRVDGALARGIAGREIEHLAGQPLSQRLQRRIQHRYALACAGGQAGKEPLFAPDGGIHLHSQLPLTLAVSLVGEGERPQTLVPLAPVCAFAQGKGRPRFKQAPEGGVQLVPFQRFLMAGERLSCLVHIAHAQPHPPAGLLRRKHRAVAQRLRPMLRQRLRARPGA